MGDSVLISKDDLQLFLFTSVRYALGRQSYIVSEVAEKLLTYSHILSSVQRKQIIREISEEVSQKESIKRTLGHKMDHLTWKETLSKLIELDTVQIIIEE